MNREVFLKKIGMAFDAPDSEARHRWLQLWIAAGRKLADATDEPSRNRYRRRLRRLGRVAGELWPGDCDFHPVQRRSKEEPRAKNIYRARVQAPVQPEAFLSGELNISVEL